MAYSDFKDTSELKQYNINTISEAIIGSDIVSKEPSEYLKIALQRAKNNATYVSEKSRSELLITPILLEALDGFNKQMALFSGCSLNSGVAALTGICDYIISQGKNLVSIESPLLCIIEAKNRSIEEGIAQTGAELYASQIINAKNNIHIPLYGCITNGTEWLFVILDGSILKINTDKYYSNDLPLLLGVFNFALTSVLESLETNNIIK